MRSIIESKSLLTPHTPGHIEYLEYFLCSLLFSVSKLAFVLTTATYFFILFYYDDYYCCYSLVVPLAFLYSPLFGSHSRPHSTMVHTAHTETMMAMMITQRTIRWAMEHKKKCMKNATATTIAAREGNKSLQQTFRVLW